MVVYKKKTPKHVAGDSKYTSAWLIVVVCVHDSFKMLPKSLNY